MKQIHIILQTAIFIADIVVGPILYYFTTLYTRSCFALNIHRLDLKFK